MTRSPRNRSLTHVFLSAESFAQPAEYAR
jgi:hypothetical protein